MEYINKNDKMTLHRTRLPSFPPCQYFLFPVRVAPYLCNKKLITWNAFVKMWIFLCYCWYIQTLPWYYLNMRILQFTISISISLCAYIVSKYHALIAFQQCKYIVYHHGKFLRKSVKNSFAALVPDWLLTLTFTTQIGTQK